MRNKIFALLGLFALLVPNLAMAQQSTLLPETTDSVADCEDTLNTVGYLDKSGFLDLSNDPDESGNTRANFLGCAIKTGIIKLWMVPFFITFFANFFIGLSGIISLLFVVLGGFWYMTGGITDDKEKGKKTIMYALVGMSITLLAWIIVNVIMVQITG
ncbi:MAG: pilin [Candidatus Peregrinibacteria bacterium]|nr:pilin [Candidatus Peregrinibacteria bacterium]